MRAAIVGTWELVAMESRYDDGAVDRPFGPDARGVLVYTPEGLMTVHLSRAGRARFASEDMWKGTPEELEAAFEGYVAYFGRYEWNEEEGIVVHHVEGSLFPNWTGDVQRRSISLDGDRLVLSTQPMLYGGRVRTSVLVWQRAPRSPS